MLFMMYDYVQLCVGAYVKDYAFTRVLFNFRVVDVSTFQFKCVAKPDFALLCYCFAERF